MHRSCGIGAHDHHSTSLSLSPCTQPPGSPLLDIAFCYLYTPCQYNSNPSSPTVTETQIPCHQLVPEANLPAPRLTSLLALSNSLFCDIATGLYGGWDL